MSEDIIKSARIVIAEMQAVLKTMEWSKLKSETGGWSSNGFCPVCEGPKFAGHKPKCPLGESIRRASVVLKDIQERGGTADTVVSNTTG